MKEQWHDVIQNVEFEFLSYSTFPSNINLIFLWQLDFKNNIAKINRAVSHEIKWNICSYIGFLAAMYQSRVDCNKLLLHAWVDSSLYQYLVLLALFLVSKKKRHCTLANMTMITVTLLFSLHKYIIPLQNASPLTETFTSW